MTTFYLVRHGQKERIIGDPPLSELGVKQAEVTGKFFKQFEITHIYSSPLMRTQQTADTIGKILQLPFQTDDRLKERMNWGDRKGETFEEFLDEWEKASRDRNYQPINGNSASKTGKRLRDFLLEIESKHRNEEVLIVTHGGAIGDFLQNTFSNLTYVISPQGTNYVEILECSITTIKKERDEFILEKVGDTAHLPEPLI